MAMIGCVADTGSLLCRVAEKPACAEEWCVVHVLVMVSVVLLDAFDLGPRPEDESGALVDALRHEVQDRSVSGARAPAGLLDQERDGMLVSILLLVARLAGP